MNPRTQLAVAAAGVTLLSSTALHAVFVDDAWITPVVGVVVAVLVGAEAGSRLGQHLVARTVWRFVGSLLGTLFYVTAVFAHQGAILGFIPRGHTWHLLRLLGDKGFDEIHDLPTPAPTYRALMYITVIGVALVAIAVDQLSVRAPLIGLPLLALYSVPEWLSKDGTGWIPLALGGSGYVGLLIREGRDRTSRWGRTVTGATTLGRNRSAAAAMNQAGWRIGAVALAVALVVPPLVPDLGHFTLAKGGGNSATTKLRYNAVANLAGDLQQSTPEHILSYRATDQAGHYLRMETLDQFQPGKIVARPLTADPGVDPTNGTLAPYGLVSKPSTTLQMAIAVGGQLDAQTLPVPVATTKISGLDGPWAYQQSTETVFSGGDNDYNQSYVVNADVLNPDPATLDKIALPAPSDPDYAQVEPEATVPTDLPAEILQIAKARTKGATTEYQQAIALQDWFLSKAFTYSFNGPSGSGYAPVISFLTTDKQGYCQQFAGDFVILARALGIPARVGFGFTPGVQQADGTYSVDSHDAHEWPELYFEGLGWLRFEPTPRSDQQTQPPDYANGLTLATIHALDNSGTKAGKTTTTTGVTSKPTLAAKIPQDDRLKTTYLHGSGVTSGWPVSGPLLIVLVVLLAMVLVGAAVPLTQSASRRRRKRHDGDPRALALLAWRETLRDAYDLGHVAYAADSPRQSARRLSQQAGLPPDAAAALDRMARAVERARYAQLAGDPYGLVEDAATVSAALFASARRRTRWRARTLPRSSTQAVAEAMARRTGAVADRLGRLTDGLASLSNRIVRRGAA